MKSISLRIKDNEHKMLEKMAADMGLSQYDMSRKAFRTGMIEMTSCKHKSLDKDCPHCFFSALSMVESND